MSTAQWISSEVWLTKQQKFVQLDFLGEKARNVEVQDYKPFFLGGRKKLTTKNLKNLEKVKRMRNKKKPCRIVRGRW